MVNPYGHAWGRTYLPALSSASAPTTKLFEAIRCKGRSPPPTETQKRIKDNWKAKQFKHALSSRRHHVQCTATHRTFYARVLYFCMVNLACNREFLFCSLVIGPSTNMSLTCIHSFQVSCIFDVLQHNFSRKLTTAAHSAKVKWSGTASCDLAGPLWSLHIRLGVMKKVLGSVHVHILYFSAKPVAPDFVQDTPSASHTVF